MMVRLFIIFPVTFDPSKETFPITNVSSVLITETSQASLDGTEKLGETDLDCSGGGLTRIDWQRRAC